MSQTQILKNNLNLSLWQLKNSYCDNTHTEKVTSKKLNSYFTPMVRKLKNPSCDKTKILPKFKNLNCDKPQKLKLGQPILWHSMKKSFVKNNLTPQQLMRCTLSSNLRSCYVTIVSYNNIMLLAISLFLYWKYSQKTMFLKCFF